MIRPHVLIAGISTRAAAESAVRAGFPVTAIDAFGDLDQHPDVRCLSLPRDFGEPFGPRNAARASRHFTVDAVAYLSSFENSPTAVRSLAAGRELWGNAPDVLRRVRDPLIVSQALRRRGFAVPAVSMNAPSGPNDHDWLIKPLRSGGGHRIRRWRRGSRVPRGAYLQERVAGVAGSVVFVAARGRVVPLGVTRQMVGEPGFGATGFRYCGSILSAAGGSQLASDERLISSACALAGAVGEEFALAGVNGIDFVARDGVPYAIEVNPRWSASMELVERAFGLSVFGIHAAACRSGQLPAFDLLSARKGAAALGKAIVFARHDITIGETHAWLADTSVRDIPQPGDRILAGHPVCTVFAAGRDAAICFTALQRRAEQVYAQLTAWERQVA